MKKKMYPRTDEFTQIIHDIEYFMTKLEPPKGSSFEKKLNYEKMELAVNKLYGFEDDILRLEELDNEEYKHGESCAT